MGFEPTERAQEICARVDAFMDEHILPREREYDEEALRKADGWTFFQFALRYYGSKGVLPRRSRRT